MEVRDRIVGAIFSRDTPLHKRITRLISNNNNNMVLRITKLPDGLFSARRSRFNQAVAKYLSIEQIISVYCFGE